MGNTFVRDQAAIGVILACLQQGQRVRFRRGVNDPYPVTIYCLFGGGESGSTTLRDGRQTGLDTVQIVVPRQPALALDTPLKPGAVVELTPGRWYSVDEIDYCCGTPDQAPMYTMTCGITAEDPQP